MQNISLIDAHCHLDFESFDEDREQVLQRAADQGIAAIIIPGTQSRYWDRINRLCTTYDNLHPCYGLHPYWAGEHDRQDIDRLDEYIRVNRPVAVGECGLDFRPHQADENLQRYFFEAQLRIAEDHDLPIVIHAVKATQAVIESLQSTRGLRGMIHSFSGSLEQAMQLVELGFYISLGGSVTYDRASRIRRTASEIPMTSLLLETDSPDQPDAAHRELRNEPAFLGNVLDTIAELRQLPREMIADQTSDNARQLFGI